ncbi:Uncharacterised protein [Mycobacterium tuberculosis]|uniref:Uncharacterized protein n=1 Tax=Mycobacterium tuberculosis TaxID=1773 RepID=A0A916PCR1_MYCTX|nr:Uncharacterised protein [Mycobacterium tuberculosis]COZ34189.1 Uncharacterised protein [Mycobacterium tuberculosis]
MVLCRCHDCDPLRLGCFGKSVVDAELVRHSAAEVALQFVDGGRETGQVKDCALQERSALRRGGVLVQRNDVGAGPGQEGAHRGDDSRAVVAPKQ